MFGFHDALPRAQLTPAYFAAMTTGCTIRNMFTALLGSTLAAAGLVATSSPAHAETTTVTTVSCGPTVSGRSTDLSNNPAFVFTAPVTGTLDSIGLAVNKVSTAPSEDLVVRVVPASFVAIGDTSTPLASLTVLGQTPLSAADMRPNTDGLDLDQLIDGDFADVQVESGSDYAVLFGSASDPYTTPDTAKFVTYVVEDCDGGARELSNGNWRNALGKTGTSMYLTLAFSPSGDAAAQSQVPAPWLKAIGRTPDAECPEGTFPSWAQWPNDGTGGFTCEWREEYEGNFRWTERPGFSD